MTLPVKPLAAVTTASATLQRFFSGRCKHGAIEMKKSPDTKQRVAAEPAREVSKVIVFASWGT